jgi:hypothetical protein
VAVDIGKSPAWQHIPLRITLGENCHDQECHRSQREHVGSETRHFSFFRECEEKRGYSTTISTLAWINHSIKAGKAIISRTAPWHACPPSQALAFLAENGRRGLRAAVPKIGTLT